MTRRRVAIVTPDAVDVQMAGPAIRAWNMAEVLAETAEVRLLSTAFVGRQDDRFDVRLATADSIADEHAWADVVVIHPSILRTHPKLLDSAAPVVVDIYDPFHLENLESTGQPDVERTQTVTHLNSVINDALTRGDFFLCASERQRDFWLGSLAALGRVNPATYDADPTLRRLVDIVPFGIPSAPPVKRRPVLRGVVPGIGPDDRVLLWGGGVYNWFDPVTLIEAVGLARHHVPELRLVFLGMTHPNPQLPPMRTALEARQRSAELGLTGRHVFFNEGWVPYDERADYLLEADVGVSTHALHIETTFAFRTRMLDYLWAGLPIITSAGDVFAELAADEEVGAAVPPGEPDALAAAIVHLLRDEDALARCAANARQVARRFAWPKVLGPLQEFCAAPEIAADRLAAPISMAQPPVEPEPTPAAPPRAPMTLADAIRRTRRRLSR